ncbi:MAG TPA: UDP-N-acetylglucosamine 2-epimerase (non-hydrolyzing) [Terriglobales bacterium]|nr:UDP-N-acetylglucosamine 2-epimerase (non-hydrolyzing) [Terriglobales bacterium]
MHILHVVGARPNFMKLEPVFRALRQKGCRQTLVHTGQHYDANMSDDFFRQLQLPEPDFNLGVGSGSHAQQTAQIMARMEAVLLERQPDLLMVYGDVNSTVAAALVSAKLGLPVAHVEAGLRSFDRSMPEEINRVITDQLSEMLFTPSADGDVNLLHEGIPREKIHLVGNVMIDSLVRLLPQATALPRNGFPARYALVTLHRPSNVDDPRTFRALMTSLLVVSEKIPVVFPVHPRTRQRMSECGLGDQRLHLCDPLSYLEFLAVQARATVVLTDSGGIQEETTYLGIPCLTLRENTERPITVTMGTNVLVGNDGDKLNAELKKILDGHPKKGAVPPLWDGHAATRIANLVCSGPSLAVTAPRLPQAS